MSRYQKVATDLNFVPREEKVLQFWKESQIFEKTVEKNKGKEPFTFYDGPPTANGKPHIGHILTRVIKDIIPRYRVMKGYDVLRIAGWDTHGLPVELEVEKQLGLDGKKQIEEYGVGPFIEKCKESVWKYKGEWERMSDRVGYWADMEHPYVTYDNNYIESVWWAIKRIADQDLLYKGHKIVPYCPRCGTALSSHEVAQGYKDVEETSATVRFALKDRENTSILAWTTTPWTLPSNLALCVNPEVEYVAVTNGKETLILARALLESNLGADWEQDWTVDETFSGADLVGLRYEPLFAFQEKAVGKGAERAWVVVADDFVTTEDGTGIVHMAPAFGEDDARVCRENGLPFVQLVDATGKLTGGTDWDGVFVKDADPMILESLQKSGKLFAAKDFEHSYPFCWRCDTHLIYYARASWFIRMTAVKEKLLAFNRSIHWLPEHIKEGRMGNFLENVVDWGLSRERYWGTPLPVWTCEDCGHHHVVGSVAELKELGRNVPENIELHKPFIDEVTLTCEKCGGEMIREPEVIDCWFDSGSMPFAQWHYPFENKEMFERNYPANFISEAIDQTRGWFYTLLAISTLLFDRPSFESCIVLGHVQDQEGRKMSKHLGNVVDPWTVLDIQGADAVRWYFYSASMPWLPSRFGPESVSEAQRKFMGTYWNTYAFYVLYADIDNFDPSQHTLVRENLTRMDLWILSRLNSVVRSVDAHLQNLRITEAARELSDFVDDLSNWYVRRSRERFWGSGMTADKEAAFMTLYTVLSTFAKLTAPFVPFMAESIWQNIVRPFFPDAPESVHLCDFPECDESFIDEQMEQDMQKVLDVVVLGRASRSASSLKNRQPLSALFVNCDELPKEYCRIIAEELNVKEVRFTEDASAYTTYNVKPQLRTLGPKYGKLIGKIGEYLKNCDGNEVVCCFRNNRPFCFTLDGTRIEIQESDALYELTQKPGFVAQSDRGLTVAIDTNLTPELIDEGFVREIISKVQTMRKEADFNVTDHIAIYHSGNERIAALLEQYGDTVRQSTLADGIFEGAEGYVKEWNINGETVTLGVKRV
jgi:isoleucyl-tRNA synthetase